MNGKLFNLSGFSIHGVRIISFFDILLNVVYYNLDILDSLLLLCAAQKAETFTIANFRQLLTRLKLRV